MSETRKYRKLTVPQKTEIVLASLRGPKTMTELCREYDIADSLAAGAERSAGQERAHSADDLRRQISSGARARAQTTEAEIAGELLRDRD